MLVNRLTKVPSFQNFGMKGFNKLVRVLIIDYSWLKSPIRGLLGMGFSYPLERIHRIPAQNVAYGAILPVPAA